MNPDQYADCVPNRVVSFRERTFPDKLRWLADKLDRDGDDEFIRFAVASAMLAVAADLEGARNADA